MSGVVVLAVAVLGLPGCSSAGSAGSAPPRRPVTSRPTAGLEPAEIRHRQLQALLRRRSQAILLHRRAAFAATLDPRSPGFRATQLKMFANLRAVHFASWAYSFEPTGQAAPAKARRRYHAATWSPSGFRLRYRIAGFDSHPTALAQYPTFVSRDGRWYLGSLSDFAGRGDTSATDLWDYAPVHVVRRSRVLVLGETSETATMTEVADNLQAAIPRVDAVWGRHWSRRVVALVPSSQHEMSLIDSFPGGLRQVAALTSTEAGTVDGRPSPVGDRVTINPANWRKVGVLGARVVLTHELTHVATRSATTGSTPKWLSEGFADYVGFRTSGLPVTAIAAELATDVRAGHPPRHLPAGRAFRGNSLHLAQAYEAGWLACRYLAQHYGQAKLVRFYKAVGFGSIEHNDAVVDGLDNVFHLSLRRFMARWRSYVKSELA